MLQSRHGRIHGVLDILRKGAGHPAHIHFIGIKSLRLNKDLVPVFIREPHHLILYGGAVTGTRSLDHTGIQRRPVKILPDDLMRPLIRISQPAGHLRNLHTFRIRGEGEGNHPFIAELLLHLAEINGPLIDAGRRSCLKPKHLHSQVFQGIRQMIGGLQSVWSRVAAHITVDAAGSQVGPCTQDHSLGLIDRAGYCPDASDNFSVPILLGQNLRHLGLNNGEMIGIFQHSSHAPAVLRLICLGPERMHRRSLRDIQHLRLNKGLVDILSHLSAQGVDLPDQMALGGSSNIGIAGHQRDAVHTDREHDRLYPQSRAGKGGFTACVARPHHDSLAGFLVYCIHNSPYFPIQNFPNISLTRSSPISSPRILPRA